MIMPTSCAIAGRVISRIPGSRYICAGASEDGAKFAYLGRRARGLRDRWAGERKAPAKPGPKAPATRKKILDARGERSERPVALPPAPARLAKAGCGVDPTTGDLRTAADGHGRHHRTRTPCPCHHGRTPPVSPTGCSPGQCASAGNAALGVDIAVHARTAETTQDPSRLRADAGRSGSALS